MPTAETNAGPALRVSAALAGLVCLVAGTAATVGFARFLVGIGGGEAPYTLRETLFVCVWLVLTISTAAAGASLLLAALRARRHNLIPGPTLYLAGVSLIIIGMFFVEARAPVSAALAVLIGAALMAAEYRSATL